MWTNRKYNIGDKVWNLVIIAIQPSNIQRRAKYECKCTCGNFTTKDSHYFYKSKYLSCWCINPKREDDRENSIFKRLYHFKIQCPRKSIKDKPTLTIEDFKTIIKKPCFYCWVEYSMEIKDRIRKNIISDITIKYNWIDRIDSNIWYEINNCVPCCSNCNMAKRLMTQTAFFDWIKRVYKFNKF